jgi:two-component system phosphate regulon sensor histidine kinase PhoR
MRIATYRFKLLILSWAALVGLLGLVYFRHANSLGRDIVAETEARAVRDLDAVAWLVASAAPKSDPAAFDDWVITLAPKLGCRITYIVDGRVAAESDVDQKNLPGIEDHADRPEVRAAEAGGLGKDIRVSRTIGRRLVYVARQLSGVPGLPDGILRVAVPWSEVEERLAGAKREAFYILGSALVCALLLMWLMARHMSRTVKTFSEAVQAIGRGDFSRRIRHVPGREFSPLAEAVNAMAGSLFDHVRDLAERRSEREAVFDALAEGLAVIGQDGRITAHNKALAALFDCGPELVGMHPLEACLNLDIQSATRDMLTRTEAGGTWRIRTRLSDGRDVEAALAPFPDRSGGRRLILVLHDVSDILKAEAAMREFLINAAHRLRTPLSSIRGYAETLLDAPPADPAKGRELLSVVLKNAEDIATVLSGMLALAKSRSAAGKARPPEADLADAVQAALRGAAPAIEDRELTVAGAGELPPLPVVAEPDGLAYVAASFVARVLAAGRPGEVVWFASRTAGPWCELAVVAGGAQAGPAWPCGEDPEPRPGFDPGAKDFFALAVCRDIVAGFGGRLWLRQEPESHGFSLCLRLKRADGDERPRA